jgi:hypothetical protein
MLLFIDKIIKKILIFTGFCWKFHQ